MRQVGWKAVHPPQDADRTLTKLDFTPDEHVFVPAGYELHVTIDARPGKELRRQRRRDLVPAPVRGVVLEPGSR